MCPFPRLFVYLCVYKNNLHKKMALTFKIQLRGIKKPPVWRRLEIPAEFTFHQFHLAIQTAFGWDDIHLYQFERSPFSHGWRVAIPHEDDMDFGFRIEDSRNTKIMDLIGSMGLTKFVYVYDFGDTWVHDITLEKIEEKDAFAYPVCLAGKGACPPEDCGGVWAYEDMKQQLLEEPDSEESRSLKEWMMLEDEEGFDPKYFDVEEVNAMLCQITAVPAKNRQKKAVVANSPRPISMFDAMKQLRKADIVNFAADLHLKVDEKAGEKEIKRQYAQALLDNPRKVLDQLPLEDLLIIQQLKEGADGENIVDVYDDYDKPLLYYYGLVDRWTDSEGNNYMHFPEELGSALVAHIDAALNDWCNQKRINIETYIMGLANLYGQVSHGRLVREIARLQGIAVEEVEQTLAEVREHSLLMKWIEKWTGDILRTVQDKEKFVYVSRYGWEMPDEMLRKKKELGKGVKKYRQFTDMEVMMAARKPCPQIPNQKSEDFCKMLVEELGMNQWQVIETCHEIWYTFMHQQELDELQFSPESFFENVILESFGLDADDPLYKRAMDLFYDYLDNMPHWLLEGHTPKEMNTLKQKRKSSFAVKQRPSKKSAYDFGNMESLFSFLDNPLIPVSSRGVNRNDPCPCGSGKKYKHCCGKEN